MGMTVAAKRVTHGTCLTGFGAAEEIGEVIRISSRHGLRDDLSGGRSDARQRLQRAFCDPVAQFPRVQAARHLGGSAERSHPVRWRARPLKLKGDLPKCPDRIHRHLLDVLAPIFSTP